jgi:prolyl oligopeptidase
LDLDELSASEGVEWTWRTSRILPRSRGDSPALRDHGDISKSSEKSTATAASTTTRALISLSKRTSFNSSDTNPNDVVVREFDLVSCSFVSSDGDGRGFYIPPGNTTVSYKSRDVIYITSDIDADTVENLSDDSRNSSKSALTRYGFPKTVREWVRGTPLKDAPVILECQSADVAVSVHIDDQRIRGGAIYEVKTRTFSAQCTKYWVRKINAEHLLPPNNLLRPDPPPFQQLQVPDNVEIDFVGNLLIINLLGSDWSPEKGKWFPQGSIIYVNAHKFVKYGPKDRIFHVLFEPRSRTCFETYIVTKQYLILSVMENMKHKLEFYKLEKDANKLRLVGTDKEPLIRFASIRPVDPYVGDQFWIQIQTYLQPTALWLADASKMDSSDKKVIQRTSPTFYLIRKVKSLPEEFKSSDLTATQKMAESKDGTMVPYFIIHKKTMAYNGRNPTLIHAYGGFGASLGPHYAGSTGIAWLERGGVLVEANIRGGGEFGGQWQQEGCRENKIRSFEDCIAVAENLIASNVCKSKTLAIRGGKIGGTLVANLYNLKPDLFGAFHCATPVIDLKRLKAMGASSSWTRELGDPETNDWELFLKALSPYHNVDDSMKKRPPILLTCTTWDGNVHPGHARKFANKLLDQGKGKKWPCYLYESVGNDDQSEEARRAFMTALAFEFLFKNTQTKTKN